MKKNYVHKEKGSGVGKKGKVKSNDEIDKIIKRLSPVGKEVKEEIEEDIDTLSDQWDLQQMTKNKYSKMNFHPPVYNKSQLLEKSQRYHYIIPLILQGKMSSFFYTLLKPYLDNSVHESIQIEEYQSLPLDKLQCGFLGNKRLMIVQQDVIDKYGEDIVHHKDKLIRWLGDKNFIKLILVPEMISIMIKDEFKLSSVDKSIDLMELTFDYGLYIMDGIDIEDHDFVQDLIGELDTDSDV